jgi:hypothetical protein
VQNQGQGQSAAFDLVDPLSSLLINPQLDPRSTLNG